MPYFYGRIYNVFVVHGRTKITVSLSLQGSIEKSLWTILRANVCKLYPKVFLKEGKPNSRNFCHKPHKSAPQNELSCAPPASIPANKLALQVVIAFV